jgi:hypothetical protein
LAKKTTGDKLDDTILDWAEELGRVLGTAESKAKGWLQQRQDVTKSLEQIRDTANGLLREMAGSDAALALIPRPGVESGKRRGRPPASKNGAQAKRKGGMSAEGRARIAEAQRARWAKLRGEAVKAGAKVRASVKKKAAQ